MRKLGFACKFLSSPTGIEFVHPTGWRAQVPPPADPAMVVDIWASPEQRQAFAAHLMPVLGELGVTPPEPEIYQTVLLD